MSLSALRSALYRMARTLGDLQAITSTKPHAFERRMGRRIVGKLTGRIIGKLFR